MTDQLPTVILSNVYVYTYVCVYVCMHVYIYIQVVCIFIHGCNVATGFASGLMGSFQILGSLTAAVVGSFVQVSLCVYMCTVHYLYIV